MSVNVDVLWFDLNSKCRDVLFEEKKTKCINVIFGLTQILHTDLRFANMNVCQKFKSSMTDIFAF